MGDDLGDLFAGVVVPEATPSPRTIRFATPPLGDGPSRAFTRDDAEADPRAQQVFAVSDTVTNVLVGPTFVAVTILRPDDWESLLAPLLRTVSEAFTGVWSGTPIGTAVPEAPAPGPRGQLGNHEPRRLDRAWSDLGGPGPEGDRLVRILAAVDDAEPERRQVAAVLLADVAPDVAAVYWARLLEDPRRSVRRAVVDTMGDAVCEELRPLLESALGDADAWIRWRALRGLAQLGPDASRRAVRALDSDPDFRVRLEAARVVEA